MNNNFIINLILLSTISQTSINFEKYLCAGNRDYIFISFDEGNKSVKSGNSSPHTYSINKDLRYWLISSYKNKSTIIETYIFNITTGKLSLQRHNFYNNENKTYFFKCDLKW